MPTNYEMREGEGWVEGSGSRVLAGKGSQNKCKKEGKGKGGAGGRGTSDLP